MNVYVCSYLDADGELSGCLLTAASPKDAVEQLEAEGYEDVTCEGFWHETMEIFDDQFGTMH
jgi:hypothetical protein